jgi:protease IV
MRIITGSSTSPQPERPSNEESFSVPTPTSTGFTDKQQLDHLVNALLAEQRSVRRWRQIWRLIWLFLVLAVIGMAWWNPATSTTVHLPHTALIDIKGEIASDAEANAMHTIDSLKSAFTDQGALAIVLLIDSPGGSPVQAGLIYDEIVRLKELHKKPVYVVVEDTCASAGYYIAAAADAIYVNKASLVGSIGVLMDGFGFAGLLDKLGVERRLMTSGENKGFLDPFSPQNEQQLVHAQSMLNQIHQQFIASVRKGRGNRLKEQESTFSGLFWTGEQAIELGLADGLGSLDYVAREIVKSEEIVDYTKRDNVAERLVKRFGAAIGEAGVRALSSHKAVMR